MDYLRGLNPEQRRAALHTEGPLLVLAGAGSGKTKTLVHRIVHLIRGRDVDPGRIAVVTFTNRAADEMKERVKAFAEQDVRGATISTFHSLGLRILREHGSRVGLPERFAIYATADQLSALRTACAEISVDDDVFDLKRILRSISDWKSRGISPSEATRDVAMADAKGNRTDDYAVLAADAYPRYEEVLKASGAVDFDDLLLLPVKLLEADEDVARRVWRRWHYLMVDEYQDTNGIQFRLARLLAGTRRNLCVVGDDDQSIYAFRGADVSNILEFERHFPGASVVTLEQNYRSTQRILAAANAVIAANPHRHPKRLRTENGVGAPVDLYEHPDDGAEAETVSAEISVRHFTRKIRWGDFAILYRTNTQSRPIEEALRAKKIPYRVVGGTSFFDRKEVADGVAYLRALANPNDEIAIRRIINYPTRGIGRTTVLRVHDLAQRRRVPFVKALHEVGPDDVGAAQVESIRHFLDLLHAARRGLVEAEAKTAGHAPPDDGQPPLARWAADLFHRVRLEEAIRTDPRNARTAEVRLDNLRDLVGSLARYERRVWGDAVEASQAGLDLGAGDAAAATSPRKLHALPDGVSPPTLADALARLALADLDDPEEDDEEANAVTLMTLHSAKGLEFSDVFLVGLEEGILPHARSLAEAGDPDAPGAADALAEERRLLYVGITRAQQRLTLSLCRARRRGGDTVEVLPSRYLNEIPEELLNRKSSGSILSEEESADLRENFFSRMKEMLAE